MATSSPPSPSAANPSVASIPARSGSSRATGVLAKTDRVDARVLADMGRTLSLPVTIPISAARAQLADFLGRRGQLVEMRKAENLRRHSARLIAEDRTPSAQAALLAAVPGIGPTVLATLLGEPPELETLCRCRIASLADLTPHAKERGTWRGARRIRGGQRKVREGLYIAALSASRRVPSLTVMRCRMRRKGKAPKTILTAIARQLLVIINAVIRKGQPIAIH